MTDATPVTGEIFLRDGVSSEVGETLGAWLAELGLATQVRRAQAMRSVEPLTWIVLIALPLHGLFRAIGTKAGEDAWVEVKRIAAALVRRNPKGQVTASRPLVLQDSTNGLQIILEGDLPDDALTQLTGLDLGRFRHGPLHYDRAAKRWRSLLDEAES